MIDVSNFGHSTHDIVNAVVVLRAGKIEAAGPANLVRVPKNVRIIDCRDTYILPGLVDGFAGLNSQEQANAWLYMGVTTIVGGQDDRRGRLRCDAHPSPHVYPIALVGLIDADSFLMSIPQWRNRLKSNDDVVELNEQETKSQLEDLWHQGVRAAYLGRDLTTERTKFIISECHSLGLVTYGEFASTPYADALHDRVNVLLHMTRYPLGLIPSRLQRALVQDPGTGEATDEQRDREIPRQAQFWAINRTLQATHPVYLAGSGASAFGTMPGISTHTELELLVRSGLTPREALAAVTSNYSAKFEWHELGLVEVGRRADLLILAANPTVDISNTRKIHSVILDGVVLDRDVLLNRPDHTQSMPDRPDE